MADSKISGLPVDTSLEGDELVPIVDDPSTAPTNKSVTVTTLLAAGSATYAPLAGLSVITGQVRSLNPLLTDVAAQIDPNTIAATNAAAKLTITTPDGSGQVVEPAIYYNPAGWNGHKYWGFITGYTAGDANTENPSIYYSDDGITFTPVPGAPFPVIALPAGGNNFDPELVEGPDGRLYGFFCEIINATGLISVKVTSTADGVTWAAPISLFSALKTVESPVGPVVYWDGAASQWVMFYTDIANYWNAVNTTYPFKRRTAATLTAGAFSAATACTLIGLPAGKSPFEAHIARRGTQLHMVLTLTTTLSGGSAANRLHFATSNDGGLTWTVATNPFLQAVAGGWDDTQIYRGDIVPLDDGDQGLYGFWYSAKDAAGHWWMGYTTITVHPPAFAFVRRTTDKGINNSNVLADDGQLQWAVGAFETWKFWCVLLYDGGTTGDIQVNFTGPAGATIAYGQLGMGNTSTSANNATTMNTLARSAAAATNFGAAAVGTKQSLIISGIVRTGATPGTVKLQWAQVTADAAITSVYTDSHIDAHRVAP